MDIRYNGAIITFEADSDELEKLHKLMCVCGHELWLHGYWIQWHYPDAKHHTAYQSQCTKCGIDSKARTFECDKFRLK